MTDTPNPKPLYRAHVVVSYVSGKSSTYRFFNPALLAEWDAFMEEIYDLMQEKGATLQVLASMPLTRAPYDGEPREDTGTKVNINMDLVEEIFFDVDTYPVPVLP